jgi:protein-S-isoprenylcysteine O-methyltransferase Ste14
VSEEPQWTGSWIATGLTIGQIVILVVVGSGEIAWLRYAGFALWGLAAVFGWVPIYQFKKRGGVAKGDSYVKTTQLVDSGLYAIVRHPQFVAWPLMNVAVALVSQHLVIVVMGLAAFMLSCMDFRKVDARDIDKFGEPYRAYMDRVPGWNFVAGLWRWVNSRAGRLRRDRQ